MSEDINYGKNNKRIIFTDTDHRHAQLTLKLKDDGMTQAKFFRSIITGYLSDDDRIRSYVVDFGDLSKHKKQINTRKFLAFHYFGECWVNIRCLRQSTKAKL